MQQDDIITDFTFTKMSPVLIVSSAAYFSGRLYNKYIPSYNLLQSNKALGNSSDWCVLLNCSWMTN